MKQITLALILVALIFGCTNQDDETNKSPTSTQPQSDDNSDLNPTSTKVVYANNWSDITMIANSAKTIFDIAAHFTTNRNACGKDAYGSLELDDWNTLATQTNAAVQANILTEEYCVTPPSVDKFMDGTVDIKVNGATRTLYTYRNGEICSTIGDHATSDALLSIIDKILVVADKEDCPNGWGSAVDSSRMTDPGN